MKQKYKVFINDQEIVFHQKKSTALSVTSSIKPPVDAETLYEQFENNPESGSGLYEVLAEDAAGEFARFIGKLKLIEAAGGIVSKNDKPEEILMIFRLGKWDLPKGKIDKGETPEEAALREIEEECGITELIITGKLEDTYHIYRLKEKLVVKRTHWFRLSTSDQKIPTPQANEGIQQAIWINTEEVKKLLPHTYASIRSLLLSFLLNS